MSWTPHFSGVLEIDVLCSSFDSFMSQMLSPLQLLSLSPWDCVVFSMEVD